MEEGTSVSLNSISNRILNYTTTLPSTVVSSFCPPAVNAVSNHDTVSGDTTVESVKAILDSGASNHFIRPQDEPVTTNVMTESGPIVILPDSRKVGATKCGVASREVLYIHKYVEADWKIKNKIAILTLSNNGILNRASHE